MPFIYRVLQRAVISLVVLGTLWLVVTYIFHPLDERLPLFLALIGTYIASAYLLLPQVIHFTTLLLRRGRIPHMTRAADGLPADPINIIFEGTERELIAAFAAALWHTADRLTLRSAWKIATCFLLNKAYPEAPFSALYLFGRRQDIGFQEPIGVSPRKRHHIRFWAAPSDPLAVIGDIGYWLRKRPVDRSQAHVWVGAGTEDVGIGVAQLTYQISHRVDKQVDHEREHIYTSLKQAGAISEERYIDAGEPIVGKYISDGRILWAKLSVPRGISM